MKPPKLRSVASTTTNAASEEAGRPDAPRYGVDQRSVGAGLQVFRSDSTDGDTVECRVLLGLVDLEDVVVDFELRIEVRVLHGGDSNDRCGYG